MKPPVFEYAAPTTLDGALAALGDEARPATVLAGGQSLVPALNFRLGAPDLLVDVNRVDGLAGIEHSDGMLRLGALTRHSELLASPLVARHCPVLAAAARHIGHIPIRNRGTLGGSVAHADPAAELPAVVAALGGTVELRSASQARVLSIEDFVLGPYFTLREADELLTSVMVPPLQTAAWGFTEITRGAGEFALAGAVAVLELDGGAVRAARIALFGVEPAPRRLPVAEAALMGVGAPEAERVAATAVCECELEVVDDPQVAHDYRRHLAAVSSGRAVAAAVARGLGA